MKLSIPAVEPSWRSDVRRARAKVLDHQNFGARQRFALHTFLARVGVDVSLVEIRTWSRDVQKASMLWALDRANGRKGVPEPWRGHG